ncbi:MAG: hypothetical protein JRI23_20275, partial [Deltaproteobacteria bacterium]|nr:hypothetical protein [Deltaproteobacteria bacterium]MBW2534223.1 hypothetical protein [Deltaproteobacteria bacterium]
MWRRKAAELARTARADPWRAAAALVAWATLGAMVAVVVSPWLGDWSTFGFHDWDVVTSFRYLVKLSLLEYGEFPGWNPFACGGYPAWGYVEMDTVLVSPYLPAYLALPVQWAIRIEAVGQGLWGAVGAYVVASCFTKSHGARLLVAALWAVNGRWGLQAASGHTWHLAYAWTPWCLYFYERARQHTGRLRHVVGAGICFAMLVYAGGIYPLPHTILLVGGYALVTAVADQRLRPLLVLAACGLVGFGLAAPKLLPVLHTLGSDPRLIASKERLDLGAFVTLLTSRDQGFFSRPAQVHPYGWHEWGMYISPVGLGVLALSFVLVEGRRERALKLVGAALVVLGFGAFHRHAPWTLLHEHLPIFRSQHVPSRFLYPAVLTLGLVAAAGLGRLVERHRRTRWLDLAVTVTVAALALDVASVSRLPMKSAMWMVPPEIPAGRTFHFEHNPPFHYRKRDWAGPMLLSMMANTGVINCYGVPRDDERPAAALPKGHRRYRGEVYVDGSGTAELTRWSPNEIEVSIRDAAPGALLVYNMNHRPGWRSDAGPVAA